MARSQLLDLLSVMIERFGPSQSGSSRRLHKPSAEEEDQHQHQQEQKDKELDHDQPQDQVIDVRRKWKEACRGGVRMKHAMAATAKRRAKALCLLAAVLILFLVILLTSNAYLTWIVLDMAKETVASGSGELQVKGSDMIAKTAIARQDADLGDAVFEMSADDLIRVKDLMLTTASGAPASYRGKGSKHARTCAGPFAEVPHP